MSNWTYISGSIQLSASSRRAVLDKIGNLVRDAKGYCIYKLPYPEEQIKLNKHLDNTVDVYSYPIIKRIVDREMDAIPCAIDYWTNTVEQIFSNGGLKEDVPDDKIIINTARELIGDAEHTFNRKNEILSSILTINSPVRNCDAEEMYDIIVNFMKNLVAKDIMIGRGILTWQEHWSPFRYTFYFNEIAYKTYCEIYNVETGVLKTDEYSFRPEEENDEPSFGFHLCGSYTEVLQCKKEN